MVSPTRPQKSVLQTVLTCAGASLAVIGLVYFLFSNGSQLILAVFQWVEHFFISTYRASLPYTKGIFLTLGFFGLFFTCLSCTLPEKHAGKTLNFSVFSWAALMIYGLCNLLDIGSDFSQAEIAKTSLTTFEEELSSLTSKTYQERTCSAGVSRVHQPIGLESPPQGRTMFLCEKATGVASETARVVVERPLSQVDLSELSCNEGKCSWQASYVPDKNVFVLRMNEVSDRTCKRLLEDLEDRWKRGLQVNGASHPQEDDCKPTPTNSLELFYAPRWLLAAHSNPDNSNGEVMQAEYMQAE